MTARPAVLLVVGWCLLTLAWVFSDPPFAGPDESRHYYRAVALSDGQLVGPKTDYTEPVESERQLPWLNQSTRLVELPADLAPPEASCYVYAADTPAACLDDFTPPEGTTEVTTTVGTYQPLPYLLPAVAINAASSPDTALRLSRLVGALLALGLLALAVAALWDPRAAGFALLGPALAVTPMVIFCASILNGSALEITGGLAFLACLLRMAREEPPPAWVWAGAGASGLILALSRSAGPVTIVLAVLTLLALLGRRDAWRKLKEGGRPALVAAVAVAIGLVGNRLWEAAYGPDVRFSLTAARLGLETALEEFPSWLEEMVGKFGYLEFDLPLLLYIFWGFATFAAVALALRSTSGRERAVLIGCVIALAVIPIVQYVVFQRHTGFGLQGRHVLPFLVVIPLLAGELLRRKEEWLRAPRARLLLVLCFAGVALAQFAALYFNGRRSAVGVDGPLVFLGDAEWSPPVGWGLWLAVAALGAACIAVAGAQAARALAPEAEAPQ